ncbi:MAG: ABC transporter substrate-binding protein [Acidimicrobiia bacterium]
MPPPYRIGLLFDYPQPDGGASFESAVRLGLGQTPARDVPVDVVTCETRGLPAGSAHDVVTGLRELERAGAVVVLGPSISDNGVEVSPVVDDLRLPCVNYTGGELTRGDWMFHYQVGSLEEEPAILAARARARGLGRVAVWYDDSIVGRGYHDWFVRATRTEGVDVVDARAVDPLAEDLGARLRDSRDREPHGLVYLGLGVAARAVALALEAESWAVPVLANSALMFGYARRDWRDGWAGWEYVDTLADDNETRSALRALAPKVAAGPLGCAAYDLGRLVGEAIVRAPEPTRAGLHEGLERVKQLPATSGYRGTTMGFGRWDRAALKGRFLVLRTWRNGSSVEAAA